MKLPITVDENGDKETFSTVEEAELSMEPIDVENNEFVVTDADGKVLSAVVVTETVRIIFIKTNIKKVKILDND